MLNVVPDLDPAVLEDRDFHLKYLIKILFGQTELDGNPCLTQPKSWLCIESLIGSVWVT